jgi:serine/threonine protein kinase
MSKFDHCPPPQLTFLSVISRRTAYGLIWLGQYNQQPCVIKMIMLTTGIHYDKNNKEYRSRHERTLSEVEAEQYFGHNDARPFLHVDFKHRRSMTPEAFLAETTELLNLAKLGMAPQVYGYGYNRDYPIHYAFLVMEKADCSLKDIYLQRDLSHHENKLVNHLIDQLHEVHGIIHGDLKPSNVGVYLDQQGRIVRGCFFDCQKIKHRDHYSPEEFARIAHREKNNFGKHIVKNTELDRKLV